MYFGFKFLDQVWSPETASDTLGTHLLWLMSIQLVYILFIYLNVKFDDRVVTVCHTRNALTVE
jgi:hypothetical protein